MKHVIDEKDRAILRAVQRDADQSIEALSAAVDLSRNACWRRVKALEADGVIKKRVALLDAEKVGYGMSVFVLIKTSNHDADWIDRFQSAVEQLPEIVGAHRMAGDLDYILRVRVPDVRGYDHFYQRLIALVPISDISGSFVMDDIVDTTAVPV